MSNLNIKNKFLKNFFFFASFGLKMFLLIYDLSQIKAYVF